MSRDLSDGAAEMCNVLAADYPDAVRAVETSTTSSSS